MNMNKALQNLYHAVSGSTTTKVNISKLLVDIHYAITGVESSVKNNWSRIIDSMATNWPEGGGGSSDFSTATLTLNNPTEQTFSAPIIVFTSAGVPFDFIISNEGNVPSGIYTIALYNGNAVAKTPVGGNIETDGAIESFGLNRYHITGDCTITIS